MEGAHGLFPAPLPVPLYNGFAETDPAGKKRTLSARASSHGLRSETTDGDPLAPSFLRTVPSPLTGVPAFEEPFGFDGSPWRLVREECGIRYATTRRWLAAASALCERQRLEALLAARYIAGQGATAVLVGDADRASYASEPLDLFLGRVEPWFVPG